MRGPRRLAILGEITSLPANRQPVRLPPPFSLFCIAMLSVRSLPRYEPVTNADIAEARLRGTVWEHLPSAHFFYAACIGFGGAIGRAGISANALTYMSLVLAALA